MNNNQIINSHTNLNNTPKVNDDITFEFDFAMCHNYCCCCC